MSESELAKQIASMPARSGGLGLRLASRTAIAAFWASWADALPMLEARCPTLMASLAVELEQVTSAVPVVSELNAASDSPRAEGLHCLPKWAELREGLRPEAAGITADLGEWQHGWQFHASSIRESSFRRGVVLPSCSASEQACLRSQAGPGSGAALLGCPTREEFRLSPTTFRSILLSRMQLPLLVTERLCEGCGEHLDARGHHRTACRRSGR